jgi:hypothetical protein
MDRLRVASVGAPRGVRDAPPGAVDVCMSLQRAPQARRDAAGLRERGVRCLVFSSF